MNPILLKIEKLLDSYFTYFKDEDILIVSEDKTSSPFACFVIEDGQLLLSLAVDYTNPITVANVVILATSISFLTLTEPFYISSSTGNSYFNEEAYQKWSLDGIDLEEIEPISEEKH